MTEPIEPPEASPDEIIDEARAKLAAADRLVEVARSGARMVTSPDGRQLTGEAILHEADQLERRALLDTVMASAMLLVEVREVLIQIRGLRGSFASARTGEAVTTSREELDGPGPIPYSDITPEQAPPVRCPIPGYHSNHLWWGAPSKDGVYQPRFFCDGVHWRDDPTNRPVEGPFAPWTPGHH